MGSVVNVNPNPEGLHVVIDGRERHVPHGESLDNLSAEQVKTLLRQEANWGSAKKTAPKQPTAKKTAPNSSPSTAHQVKQTDDESKETA